ncbi:ACP S-malonyltransferase [Amycolatopsis sp. H20-H5]|uniref:ACP S-malonyltransferase n=1 Tax=Amycolatopsis sp. H20-H5 TaxID=3046309 RepID=UPI002DB98F52|nr:ACP S-malonyltransferase [Amycolatopsis sp. H20-H5]MEC3981060.1 ACP S-malonyltransferase [Amycolatopsis sp. H20-H5]
MSEAAGPVAVVFPGMGPSTFAEVGRFMVLDRYARRRIAVADEVLGASLLAGFRAAEGVYHAFTQVAFLVNSLALADRAEDEHGLRPDFCVGASLGQRAAAAYVGSVDFPAAIRLTFELARCEEEYFAAEPDDLVTHCFVRVPDVPFRELVDAFCARGEWIELSGHLDEGSYLVSLRSDVLDELIAEVRALGGYSMQTMRPPVHARRFAPLRAKAEAEVLSQFPLAEPSIPVISDQDGRVVGSAAELRTILADTFDRPIDWPAVVGGLNTQGVGTVYVTGPDLLFHRLDVTTANFHVVPVTPKSAAKPVLVH